MGRRNPGGDGNAAATPIGPPMVFLWAGSWFRRGGRSGLSRRGYLRRAISADAAVGAGVHRESPRNRCVRPRGDDGLSLVATLSTLFQPGADALYHAFRTADPRRPSPTDVRRRLQTRDGVSPVARPRSSQ